MPSLISWIDTKLSTVSRLIGVDTSFYTRIAVWNGLAYFTQIIRGVCTTFLLARWLDPIRFGQFRYVLVVYSIGTVFSLQGLASSISRGVAQGDTAVIRPSAKLMAQSSMLSSLVIMGFAVLAWMKQDHATAASLLFVALITPISSIGNVFSAILIGEQRVKQLTGIVVCNNLLFSSLFVLTVLEKPSLFLIVCAYFGLDLILKLFWSQYYIRHATNVGDAKKHLQLGKHLSAIGILQGLAQQVDQVLLQWIGGYGNLASYSVAIVLPEQLKDFINSFSSLILSRFAKQTASDKTQRAARRHFWLVTGLTAGCVGLYALFAPLLLPLLFPKYAAEVWPSIVYALGIITIGAMVGTSYAQAHHHLKQLWRFHMGNAVLQITTNLLFIPLLGSWGAIISKTVTRFGSLGLIYPSNQTEPDEPKKSV